MHIGVLTGGGDCPGLNAVIRAAVHHGVLEHGHDFVGFSHGWLGLLDDATVPLGMPQVRGIAYKGGTILGTSRETPRLHPDGIERVEATFARHELDGLLVIGGDGTLSVANELAERGMPLVGVPKTIDNDLQATDVTFGFDTAVSIATDAIDRLHTTAESHDRVMVVEVMGRHAGWIALYAGIASAADTILVPEDPFDIDEVCANLRDRHRRSSYSIVVIAEGVVTKPGTWQLPDQGIDRFGHIRLGGVAHVIAPAIEERTGYETRATVLGYVQRGGTPTAADRVLATRFGFAALEALSQHDFGVMVALHGTSIERVPLRDAVAQRKTADLELRRVARAYTG